MPYLRPHHACPRCRSGQIDRVPRRGLRDLIVRLFGRRPYRCHACRQRFYDRPTTR